MRAGRALRQFPFVPEQVLEEVVAPLRGCGGPSDFEAAAGRVARNARAKFVLPAEALQLDVSAFRFYAHERRIASPVGLAERVSAGNQCDGLLVIHSHAGEGLSDISRRRDWIRLAVRPFRIHVDQAHLYCSERILKVTVAGVTLVRQPLALGAPIDDLFGFPDIFAPAAKSKRLEAHRLEGDVARENHEVGPRYFSSILLLDRPQQPARLVEVHVVRPAIERRKTLLAGASTAAAIADPIGTRAVPRHTNKKPPIMAKVGRPPILRVRH